MPSASMDRADGAPQPTIDPEQAAANRDDGTALGCEEQHVPKGAAGMSWAEWKASRAEPTFSRARHLRPTQQNQCGNGSAWRAVAGRMSDNDSPPWYREKRRKPMRRARRTGPQEGAGDDEGAAFPAPLRRPPAETSGLPANAPSARGLPDVRQRASNDQAHTDAAARFALFELLPVLHGGTLVCATGPASEGGPGKSGRSRP